MQKHHPSASLVRKKKAKASLRRDQNISTLPLDEGGSPVVLNTPYYHTKVTICLVILTRMRDWGEILPVGYSISVKKELEKSSTEDCITVYIMDKQSHLLTSKDMQGMSTTKIHQQHHQLS